MRTILVRCGPAARVIATRCTHAFYRVASTQSPASAASAAPAAPTSTSTKAAAAATAAVPTDLDPTLAPPPSTLPPPLELPIQSADLTGIPYYYRLGKAYLTFYKTGLKALYHNRWRLGRPLYATLPAARLSPPLPSTTSHWLDLYERGRINRGQFLLLDRAYRDGRTAPLLALVLGACGEFTPLVAPFLPWAVPAVCTLPTQVESRRKVLEARRRESWDALVAAGADWDPAADGMAARPRVPADLDRARLLHVGRCLGLYARWWETRLGRAPPARYVRWRVRRAVRYIRADDVGMIRGGAPKGLPAEEVRIACEARGMDVLGKSDGECRAWLERWLAEPEGVGVLAVLVRRPEGLGRKEPRVEVEAEAKSGA